MMNQVIQKQFIQYVPTYQQVAYQGICLQGSQVLKWIQENWVGSCLALYLVHWHHEDQLKSPFFNLKKNVSQFRLLHPGKLTSN